MCGIIKQDKIINLLERIDGYIYIYMDGGIE